MGEVLSQDEINRLIAAVDGENSITASQPNSKDNENKNEKPETVGAEKITTLTVYGHDRTIDSIMLNTFDTEENKNQYCRAVGGLELGDKWIEVHEIKENTQYPVETFIPLTFDIVTKLDNRSIQVLLRNLDSLDLAVALKGEPVAVCERIFTNMSKRAAAMLKEDIKYMGSIPLKTVKEKQEKIISRIVNLVATGEIIINEGETIE